MTLMFTVSRTFETYTPPEDPEAEAIDGETDHGYMFEPMEMDFRDVLHELSDMSWLSDSHAQAGTWAMQEHWTRCYQTGETRSEAVHITAVNGKPITTHQLRRIFRAAKLIKPRDYTTGEARAHLMRCERKAVV